MVADLVTTLGPEPPAATGLPTPNLFCISFAFLVRVGRREGKTAGGWAVVRAVVGSLVWG